MERTRFRAKITSLTVMAVKMIQSVTHACLFSFYICRCEVMEILLTLALCEIQEAAAIFDNLYHLSREAIAHEDVVSGALTVFNRSTIARRTSS